MKVKDLKKILKNYDNDTEIIIWWLTEKKIDYWRWMKIYTGYAERPMEEQDIIQSTYNWKKRIVINFRY